MLHCISLFIGNHQISTFNIHSIDNISYILTNLDKNLVSNFNSKIKYLKNNTIDIKNMLNEIKILSYHPKVSQNTLIVLNIIQYYIKNNFKPFIVTLTCNDFKLESKIDLKNCNLNNQIYC